MTYRPTFKAVDAKILSLQFENAMSTYDKKFRPEFGGMSFIF